MDMPNAHFPNRVRHYTLAEETEQCKLMEAFTDPAAQMLAQTSNICCAITGVRLSAEGGVDRLFVAKG